MSAWNTMFDHALLQKIEDLSVRAREPTGMRVGNSAIGSTSSSGSSAG